MNTKVTATISLLVFQILQSCIAIPSTKIPEAYNINNREGLVIGAISIENKKPIYNSYSIKFRGVNNDFESWIYIMPAQLTKMKLLPDFFDDDYGVHLFALQLPPGDYEFYEMVFFSNSGYIQSTRTMGNFNLDFKSEANNISYIGEFKVSPYNILTFTEVEDKYERDLGYLKDKHPNILWDSMKNNSLKTEYITFKEDSLGLNLDYPNYLNAISGEQIQVLKRKNKEQESTEYNAHDVLFIQSNDLNNILVSWQNLRSLNKTFEEYYNTSTNQLLQSFHGSKLNVKHQRDTIAIDNISFKKLEITFYSKKEELLFTEQILTGLIDDKVVTFLITHTNPLDERLFSDMVKSSRFSN